VLLLLYQSVSIPLRQAKARGPDSSIRARVPVARPRVETKPGDVGLPLGFPDECAKVLFGYGQGLRVRWATPVPRPVWTRKRAPGRCSESVSPHGACLGGKLERTASPAARHVPPHSIPSGWALRSSSPGPAQAVWRRPLWGGPHRPL